MNRRIASYLSFALVVTACSGGEGGSNTSGQPSDGSSSTPGTPGTTGGTCGDQQRTGTSTCGAGTCSAGQYCYDRYHTCKVGCTSDSNCGPAERCVKCGTDSVGDCRSCSEDPKAACQTQAATCDRDSSGDGQCGKQIGPMGPEELPPKAYVCPPSVDPPSGCKQAEGSFWCCP